MTLLGLTGVLTLLSPCRAQVVCNEIMADNHSAVPNGGTFPDYIELHNRGTAQVTLTGMSLTDDPALPRRFVFGSGISIPAGGYLVVWADSATDAPGIHTGFGLGAEGERVQLYAADGATLLDEVSFGIQARDLAIGVVPEGTGAWTLVRPTPGEANAAVTVGAPDGLRLNEWMARPVTGEDWLEVYNTSSLPIALAGLVLTDSAALPAGNRPIPALSFIAAHGYTQFFASDLVKQDANHLDFKLSTSGETLRLLNTDRITVLDQVTFGDQTTGVSQGRAPDGGETFAYFPVGGETPGAPNFAGLTQVAISEVLSHTDPPLEDAIELVNLTATPQNIGHWWLSDSGSKPRKYRIPAGTVIPPYGFVVFYEYQFASGTEGFGLDSSAGDEVFLSSGDAQGNLTGGQTFVTFGALGNGVSVGRYPTSQGVDFVPLSRYTFGVDSPSSLTQFRQGKGATNAPPRVGPVVISELHYLPLSTANGTPDAVEFLELYNPTSAAVPLYDVNFPTNSWRVRGGISFDFAFGASVAAKGFLVLVDFDPVAQAALADAFRTRYGIAAGVPILGPFTGRLSDTGETLELLEPDEPEGPDDPNTGFVPYMLVEGIGYVSAAPWPVPPSGSGQSLQRQQALEYADDPVNWRVAPPTPGRLGASDSDGDGMDDAWETAHGLDPAWPGDAVLDADSDGANNQAEYGAGTDPRDAQSVLRITQARPEADALRLVFNVMAGRSYELWHRADLDVSVGHVLMVIPPVSQSGSQEVLVPASSVESGFYWVRVLSSP